MRWPIYLPMVVFLAMASFVSAGGDVKHRIMVAELGKGPNRLAELDADGNLVSEYPFPGLACIFQVLPEGRVLYGFGGNPTGVAEIDRDKRTVWKYLSNCTQVLGCERLPNGNTLVGEQGPCRAVEIDPDGKVVHSIKLTTTEENNTLQLRNLHKLANGNILAALEGEGAVREFDPKGNVVWEYKNVTRTFDAHRLANGNTLIACGNQKRIIEVTPAGAIAWTFGPNDAPDLNLTWIAGLQVLKNGNYVVTNWLNEQEGKGAHAFEVTRGKRVVWTFANHDHFKSVATVRVLDDR